MEPLSYRHWIFSGQRQPIMRRVSRLHSWDVFAYDLLPNRLRLLDRSAEGLHEHTLKTIQKTQWNILGDDETSHALHSCLPCGSQQRSTSANRAALSACALGTFSHTSCFRIDCTLAGLSLRQLSIPSKLYRRQEHFRWQNLAVNVSQSPARFALGSWDVFAR